MNTPRNDYEALVLALHLAVTAETDDQSRQCVQMAGEIASRLTPPDVERAKAEACGL